MIVDPIKQDQNHVIPPQKVGDFTKPLAHEAANVPPVAALPGWAATRCLPGHRHGRMECASLF